MSLHIFTSSCIGCNCENSSEVPKCSYKCPVSEFYCWTLKICCAAQVDVHTNFSIDCAYYTGSIKMEYELTVS